MATKLIHSPLAVGRTSRELAENPGMIREVHEDVLRDLMTTPHAIEKPRRIPLGAEGNKPRRRVCV